MSSKLVLLFVLVILSTSWVDCQGCSEGTGLRVSCTGQGTSYINSLSADASPYNGFTYGSTRVSPLSSYVVAQTTSFSGNFTVIAMIGNPVVYVAQVGVSLSGSPSIISTRLYSTVDGSSQTTNVNSLSVNIPVPSGNVTFSLTTGLSVNSAPETPVIGPTTAVSAPAPACQKVPGYKFTVASSQLSILSATMFQGDYPVDEFSRSNDPVIAGIEVTVRASTLANPSNIHFITSDSGASGDFNPTISTVCKVSANAPAGTITSGTCYGITTTFSQACTTSGVTLICPTVGAKNVTISVSTTTVFSC